MEAASDIQTMRFLDRPLPRWRGGSVFRSVLRSAIGVHGGGRNLNPGPAAQAKGKAGN